MLGYAKNLLWIITSWKEIVGKDGFSNIEKHKPELCTPFNPILSANFKNARPKGDFSNTKKNALGSHLQLHLDSGYRKCPLF